MKVTLIQPDGGSRLGYSRFALPEPLSLETVAANFDDAEVRIVDCRLEEDWETTVAKFEPHLIGITALTPDVPSVLEMIPRLPEGAHVMVGGHHATLMPTDFRVWGIHQVVQGDFDRYQVMPIPRRDLTAGYRDSYTLYGEPITSVYTSRGCPYRCNFCSVREFHRGRFFQLSADRVLEELAGIDGELVGIVDDTMFVNAERDRQIAEGVIVEGKPRRFVVQARADVVLRNRSLVERWVEAGLQTVFLGLEGDAETLRSVGKGSTVEQNDEAIRFLQSLDVLIWAAFIVHPAWTRRDFNSLKDYVASRQLGPVQYTILTPLPGTKLWRQWQAELLTSDYRSYDTLHAVVETVLPRREFYEEFASLHKGNVTDQLYNQVRSGRLKMEVLKRAAESNKALSDPTVYWELDPVLGKEACYANGV